VALDVPEDPVEVPVLAVDPDVPVFPVVVPVVEPDVVVVPVVPELPVVVVPVPPVLVLEEVLPDVVVVLPLPPPVVPGCGSGGTTSWHDRQSFRLVPGPMKHSGSRATATVELDAAFGGAEIPAERINPAAIKGQ
jgi:hypothetical protein